ncbi:MAG TPA: EamA family transporter [Candidatus Limnocylindrales bacterium]
MSEKGPRPERGVLEVLGAAVLFGTTGTTASFAPPGAGSVAIGSARLVVGGTGLFLALPLLGGRRRTALALWRGPWGFTAGLMTALYQLGFFAGVALAGVALGTLVTIGTGPILVGLLSWLLLGERPALTWWLSTAVCVTGLVLLTLDGSGQSGIHVGGLVLSVVAAAGYAFYTVAAKRLMNRGAHAPEVMASAFTLGGIVLFPVLLLAGASWMATLRGLVVALWLGLGTTTVAYFLFGRGLRVLPAGPVATLVLAEPLVATLLGVGVLGERLGPVGWLGAALVATGLALQGVTAVRGRADTPQNVVEGALA